MPMKALCFTENSLNCAARKPLINLVKSEAPMITLVIRSTLFDASVDMPAFEPTVMKKTGIKIP